MTKYTKLQDYTTEEIRAELKCRSDLAKAEKTKVKRCRMCKHWGEVDYWGKDLSDEQREWLKKWVALNPVNSLRLRTAKIIAATHPLNLPVSILNN